jgi:hypothetical protein
VPVKEGEDKPAGKAVVLLDGWGYQDTHETLNPFSWGPEGWRPSWSGFAPSASRR